jgi:hypothetical protein
VIPASNIDPVDPYFIKGDNIAGSIGDLVIIFLVYVPDEIPGGFLRITPVSLSDARASNP